MVHSLSSILDGSEFRVFQASFDPPGARRHFDSPIPFHPFGPLPRLPLLLRPLAYAIATRRLRGLKQRLGIDVTISNLWGADLISSLSGGGDRKIALCHINVVDNPTNHLMMRFRPLVAAIYHRFDHVVAVSEDLAKELKTLYRLPDDRITHIDNFVDRPDSVSRWPLNDGIQRFVWCGRFSQEKNVPGLLHAWAKFSSGRTGLQLVLVGDGPERASMQRLAASLGLRTAASADDAAAQVAFAGSAADPASYMLGARALVLSSSAEGLPMVVLEALSLGVPVLAADCPSGGVRTALLGSGTCDPERTSEQVTPAGALLPVPSEAAPRSMEVWVKCLAAASEDDAQHDAWCLGALERANRFSSHTARHKWLQMLSL